jgi:hypothetical protein
MVPYAGYRDKGTLQEHIRINRDRQVGPCHSELPRATRDFKHSLLPAAPALYHNFAPANSLVRQSSSGGSPIPQYGLYQRKYRYCRRVRA